MLVLGINDSHDASACLIENGKTLVALSEERCQRIKSVGGFPHNAIEACLKAANFSKKDIDHVAIATERLVPTNLHNLSATFGIKDYWRLHEEYYYPLLFEDRREKLSNVFPDYKPVGDMVYPLEKVPFITTSEVEGTEMEDIENLRLNFTSEFLGIDQSKISFYRHHRCHAFYAYYVNCNRSKNIVVVTSDSGGDNAYTSINIVNNGVFKKIHEARNSLLGKIYSSVTLLLGMMPDEHEYKVMGLAPYATEYHKSGPREIFLKALNVDGLDFVKASDMKDFFFYFKEKLKTFRFDGIAGGLQDFVEIRLVQWFQNIIKETKINDIVFTGGVANNVKANKRLTELDSVKSLFVPFGPGDESLSIGAAYCAIYDKLGAEKARDMIFSSSDAYLGGNVDVADHESFKKDPFILENYDRVDNCDLSLVASVIAKGEIVALCHGKMEFGSRALGHRSLVADPSKPESVRKLNDLIKKRDFWMPFTPSVLDGSYDDYVINPKDIDSSYMTTTFDSTELGRAHLRGAVHPYDYTVRPQKVSSDICSMYYQLISEFKKITGIGALLNTSLNIHGKPIVMNPTDLLNEILLSGDIPLKFIYIEGSFYMSKVNKIVLEEIC